jgi:hypothetical protein
VDLLPGSSSEINHFLGCATHLGFEHQAHPSDPFPSTKAVILRHISSDSDGGITRMHFARERGAHSPRGIHPGSKLTSRRVRQLPVLRTRAGRIIWDSFQAISRSTAPRANFPDFQQLPSELPLSQCIH